MNPVAIQALNAINRAFYHVTAAEFDRTRGSAWAGWEPLLAHLPTVSPSVPLRTLDVGCGNGRFGLFLAQRLAQPTLDYHGMDNNPVLLNRAQTALTGLPGVSARLELHDVVEHPPTCGDYELVVAFGLLHHIPGAANRQVLVRALAARTAPGGLLAFACWQFYEFARFRERIVPWGDDLAAQVEQHDYLLDWRRGERALRYCHYVDDAEFSALVAAADDCTLLVDYRADGEDGRANRYCLLRRKEPAYV